MTDKKPEDEDSIVLIGDGEARTAADQLRRLNEIAATTGFEDDDFSRGGSVGQLERAMAERLGKERAIFMPTGTLANHLAIRRHCGTGGRAAVQEQSHLFNDTGDSLQRLSSINLVPLATGRVYFTAAELKEAYETSITGRVMNPISAAMVETPVRRRSGQIVPWSEVQAISEVSRSLGIPSHLDGARLFMVAAATGNDVRDYSDLFDSVYVSLYKFLGAPFGGILAGNAHFIEGMYHDRRMFGGGLAQTALVAALALHGLPGFAERFTAALEKGKELMSNIDDIPGLSVTPFEHGSNIFPLALADNIDLDRFKSALVDHGIFIYPEPGVRSIDLHVNATMLRRPNDELTAAFSAAAAQATA